MLRALLITLLLAAGWLATYLLRPFESLPEPAAMSCLADAGRHEPLGAPRTVYGLGLSFADHIRESPGLYDPDAGPPAFLKHQRTLIRGDVVRYPTRDDLLSAVADIDANHAASLRELDTPMPVLMDYEVEVGLVVLEAFPTSKLGDPAFAPPIGYFVANDLTARFMLALAPSVDELVTYLEAGKSLTGFLPVGERAWIPAEQTPDGGPCVRLTTDVDDQRRQDASFADIIVTPKQALAQVARRYGLSSFEARDWLITGTPSGVAAQVPAWQQRMMVLLDPGPAVKIRLMANAASSGRYLAPGQTVTVAAEHLGSRTIRIE